MELMLILPWLLGAGILAAIFDNDDSGGGGSTVVDNTVKLTSGDDSNLGTSADDLISGLAGNDSISGGQGNDVIEGDQGADNLQGGFGDDVVVGDQGNGVAGAGDGRDVIQGGDGNDILLGDNGADGLFGQNGNDIMFGGFGGDNVFGSNGDDIAVGHRGEDQVRGGLGDDIVSGNMLYKGLMTSAEAQTLQNNGIANDPADIARLGQIAQRDDLQADTVFGDGGDDDLYIGDSDIGIGGAGADDFFVSQLSGTNGAAEIRDYVQGTDTIVVEYDATATTPPTITVANVAGNAEVSSNGVVVATVTGQGAILTVADVTVQPV